ncbi:hypothetical protein QTG54_002200 [Skeletonema marinoi]|uniref:Uncharacterized protein n=1 Tax=Skeletonema marinoi TaxID=267567 RepID=A0AAD8YHW9_9STRA|nr:hypothetical protein QTG54_002200 [Skeletonema marinoi]
MTSSKEAQLALYVGKGFSMYSREKDRF